jgi:DNA-binding transcriptional LysR family regulator
LFETADMGVTLMNIEHLQYFLAVAKNLNFSSTADDLCLSQSSLSKHIKSLEGECKVKLFNRNTHSIELTDAGAAMKMHAEKVMDNYNEMMAVIQRYSVHTQKAISLYTIPVLSCYGITEMLIKFSKMNPDINYKIQETETQYVLKAVETGKADIGLIRTRNFEQSGLKLFPIFDDELVLAVNNTHRFTQRQVVSLKEAANEQFYLLGQNNFLYQLCIDECLKCGFYPNHAHFDLRLNGVKSFIKQSHGISMLMETEINYWKDPEFSIIKLKERPILTLTLIMRDDMVSDTCMRFIDFTSKYFMDAKKTAVK